MMKGAWKAATKLKHKLSDNGTGSSGSETQLVEYSQEQLIEKIIKAENESKELEDIEDTFIDTTVIV